MEATTEETEPPKYSLYSMPSIGGATFLGGPLAAGITIRRNFINLGKPKLGSAALWVCVIATVMLFGALSFIPEDIVDKIPGSVFPVIHVGLAMAFVQKYLGPSIAIHQEQNGPFYSGWKAFGVGTLSLVGTLGLFMGVFFTTLVLDNNDTEIEIYNNNLAIMSSEETKALEIYPLIDSDSPDREAIVKFIDETSVPSLQKALVALDKMDSVLEALEPDLKKQNLEFREYFNLRLEVFKLYREAASGDGDFNNEAIQKLEAKIQSNLNR